MSSSFSPSPPDSPRDLRRARLARLSRVRRGLPRQKIARRSGADAPKNPLLASAGRSPFGAPLPAGRATRGIAALAVGALALIGGRWFFTQRFDLGGEAERVVRAQFLPQLEKQLGAKIEVGSVETDWLGRVSLQDVVIGRDARLPTGALAHIKSVEIGLDLPGLALHRATFPNAIRSVSLDQPQIYLRRDRAGFNWSRLLKSSGNGPKVAWTGRISARDGRLYYLDTALASASGAPFILDARGLDATLDALAGAPYRFSAVSKQPFFGKRAQPWQPISASGSLDSDLKSGLVSLQNRALPLSSLGDFAFPRRDIVVRGGTASGSVQLALSDGAVTPRGTVEVERAAATFSQILEPNSKRPLQIDALSGPVAFAGRAFSTSGAKFRALDAPFEISGAASLDAAPIFDVQIETAALPVSRLRAMLPATLPAVSSGPAHLSAHFSGTARQISTSGNLDAPQTQIRQNANLRAAFPAFRAAFAADFGLNLSQKTRDPLLNWRFATRFSTGDGSVFAPQGRLNARFDGTLRAAKNGGLEVNASARDFAGQSPKLGESRGELLQISASTPQLSAPLWTGTLGLTRASTAALKLGNFSPAVARAVHRSGELSAHARFASLDLAAPTRARSEATFSLSGLDLNASAFGSSESRRVLPLQNGDFRLSALRGRLGLANGRFVVSRASAVSAFGPLRLEAAFPLQQPAAARFALSLPDVRLGAARFAPFLAAQNVALDGDWRGRLSLLSGAKSGSFGLDFDLQTELANARGLGKNGARIELVAPRLRGQADFDSQHPTPIWNGAATISAASALLKSGTVGRFASLPASLSGARARALNLNFVAKSGAARPVWAGELSAQSLSAPLSAAISASKTQVQNTKNVNTKNVNTKNVNTKNVNTKNVNTKNVAPRVAFVTLRQARAHLAPAPNGVDFSRFSANFGSGRVAGTAQISDGAARARLLASAVDLGAMQRLFAPSSLASARFSGLADAIFEMTPKGAPRAQVRLSRASVAIPAAGASDFQVPLDSARAQISFSNGEVAVRDVLAWSEGARLSGSADLGASWRGQLQVSGVSLARLARFPGAGDLRTQLRPEGLLSGDFSVQIDPKNLSNALVTGPAQLRLASIAGAGLDELRAQIRLKNGAAGWQVAATEVSGQIEGAPFSGEVNADLLANSWRVRLATKNLQSSRLARLAAGQNGTLSPKTDAQLLERALPVSGVVGADIDLSGTWFNTRGDQKSAFSPRAGDGFVRISSGPLEWRGKTVGALRVDLVVENGVARAQTLQLSRPGNAATGADVPVVSVSGQLPLDSDSPGLDAQIRVATAPLSFFTDALNEGRDALSRSGIAAPLLDRAVSYVADLPRGTTGQVALSAEMKGNWRDPHIRVSNLTLRDGRTRVPAGGFSPPATLDAAFALDDGAITVERAEFRLKKAAPIGLTAAEAADEEDDTLLRIEPGGKADPDGEIALSADVFNANLSQLSTWVPALRDPSGGPLLRGELTEFSFRVGGPTLKPLVTGSIQAENLSFNAYTLDRLRVSRFEIGDRAARIEPGNLTIVKGAFQSSSAYGSLPWSWAPLGPVKGGLLDVHFPLQTRDFGALTGVFVPALAVASAEEFGGSVDVAGTLDAPQLTGAVSIRGGQLRLDPQVSGGQRAFDAGLTALSGTVRFVGGNQLLIDADDPLKGRFVPAADIVGRPTRREDAGAAPGVRPAIAAGGPEPGRQAGQAGRGARATRTATKVMAAPKSTSKLAGEWILRGGVTRPAVFDLGALSNPLEVLSRLRYDLSLSLDKGQYSVEGLPGAEDISAGVIWKTGDGDEPQNAQNLRWMLAARGQKPRKAKNGGQLTSFGSLTLPSDLGDGIESLGRAVPADFSGESDFSSLPVRRRIDFVAVSDRRTQVVFNSFAASLTGAGSGVLDGRLVLDNRPNVQRAPAAAVGLQRASLTGRDARPSLFGPSFDASFERAALRDRVSSYGDAADEAETVSQTPRRNRNAAPAVPAAPLRLGGTLTLESAEIYGAPAGGEGGALLLSRLPDAPMFDVRLDLGRDVQIVTSSFRAGLSGEVVVSGSPRNPQILGVLQTRDGQVRFPNARARVEEGRVSVSLNRDPDTDSLRTRVEVDATARGQAGIYTITLHMRGPLDLSAGATQSLNIDVTSNPPLSQSEAFEQLLGTVPQRSDDGTIKSGALNRAYTSAIVNVLSAPLFAGVEQTLAQTLGLSSVGFEYRFNEPLAIQVTKTLGDRVIVSYRRSLGSTSSSASNLSADGRTPFEFRLEYRIKGDYLLGLRTDERQIPSITIQRSRQF